MTSDDFADLPSLENVRRQLLAAAGAPTRRRRWIRRLIRRRALAVLVAIAVPAGAAIATISQPNNDRGVRWQTVAHGRDPNFGRYEIVRGEADRRYCFGISLPDQDLPGVARAIAATCAENSVLSVAFMRGQEGTLAYGLASAGTDSITLGGAGRQPREGRLFEGPGDTRYFIVSSSDRIPGAQVTARDANGNTLSQQTSSG